MWWSAQRVFWYLIVAALAVVLLGVAAGVGPLGSLKHDDANSSPPTRTTKSSKAARPYGTTTTTFGFAARQYHVGDCVIWKHKGGVLITNVVACDQPHFIEIAGGVPMTGRTRHKPNAAEWLDDIGKFCPAEVTKLIGRSIVAGDPYEVGGIHPLHDAWAEGYRTLWCGVESARSQDGQEVAFTGDAKNAA